MRKVILNVNDVHLLKALSPIEVTDEGILTCAKDEHS